MLVTHFSEKLQTWWPWRLVLVNVVFFTLVFYPCDDWLSRTSPIQSYSNITTTCNFVRPQIKSDHFIPSTWPHKNGGSGKRIASHTTLKMQPLYAFNCLLLNKRILHAKQYNVYMHGATGTGTFSRLHDEVNRRGEMRTVQRDWLQHKPATIALTPLMHFGGHKASFQCRIIRYSQLIVAF